MSQTSGSFSTVSGVDELAQKVSHLLNINKGELNWQPNIGLDQREILMDGSNPALVNSIINRYLSDVFGSRFRHANVIGNIKHLDRTVSLNMTVTFNAPGQPLHINTSLEIGGD